VLIISSLAVSVYPNRVAFLSQPSYIYLQEDGLELWQVLLRRSTSLSPEMLSLLPLLVSLLANGTDILPRCLAIFESYLLLDSPSVVSVRRLRLICPSHETRVLTHLRVQACASPFFASIHGLLEGLKFEAVKVVLHALNTVYQTAPTSAWAGALESSGCFATYLKVISGVSLPSLFHFIPTGSATFTGSLSAGRVGFDHHQMWATFVSTYRLDVEGLLTIQLVSRPRISYSHHPRITRYLSSTRRNDCFPHRDITRRHPRYDRYAIRRPRQFLFRLNASQRD
jgi:hypothetical protein